MVLKKVILNLLYLNLLGAHRRFEFKGKIDNKASVYDDYGHHPTEILATAKSLSNKKYNQSWDDFANSLLNFDNVIVLDIYAAREKNTYGITSKDLVNQIISIGKDAKYIPDFNECVTYIKNNVQENDIVITLGAGTVTEIGPMLIKG